MIVNRRLKMFLIGLGKTSRQVANKLKEMRTVGVRQSYDSCPISEAVKKKFRADRVISDDGMVGLWSNTLNACVETPPAIKKFIIDFDKGKFPELLP